jgi:hypothetical protein
MNVKRAKDKAGTIRSKKNKKNKKNAKSEKHERS